MSNVETMPAQEEWTDVNEQLADATPIEIIRWGVERFFPRLTMATAFGPGAFTEQLLKVWNKGAYRGNYARLHATIRAQMPPTQTPNLFQLGPAAVFAQQQPFSV